MTPVELSRTVLRAVRRAVDEGELSVAVPARAVVTPPGPGGRGDYATNIALQLARPAGRPPLQVAEILRPHLSRTDGVAAVEITGPGFLNIHLDRAAVTALVRQIQRDHGTRPGHASQPGQATQPGQPGQPGHGPAPLPYGHSDALAGHVVRLRIPYDIRAEVVADALVRIVGSQGGRVEVHHVRPHVTPEADEHEDAGARAGAGARARAGTGAESEEVYEHASLDEPAISPIDLRPVPAPEDPTPLGPDALRWALLHPAAHDRPRITADLLVQRAANPLFRVRYAHARARALTRNAAALGFTGAPGDLNTPDAPHTSTPHTPPPSRPTAAVTTPDAATAPPKPPAPPTAVTIPDVTTPLVSALTEYPSALARAATHRAPDRLARHLVVLADALLAFQHTVLPRGDEKPSAAHRARLALAEAAGTVLAGGLSLLGIDAPEYL
ncbi:DALR anticodon-binding domain-containing protein [Streptomyces caniscabiei]|uniref:arginine--tRNA ligase n=1 Tax=Streptomyces caniscabiei TaxID=2746961 RepID=A0A927QM53_9ACTN|nr:DALR anticodon-binding domain-containing protein [Streptomyces caniscabiei]MBD9726627.1 arginine--tRNA ligase [Streptomyces caniscabiei]MDX3514810.1 DALR anticodon-binding domain-containing protein [Streptomyces caniscabiei]MDX3723783.1 DALR anticodon-binding domain-containing protein [Streptomyces caniscabiei]WEO24140.1 DALR anticodon-binding domain-containing protein [Streptomyces caniscabiei]